MESTFENTNPSVNPNNKRAGSSSTTFSSERTGSQVGDVLNKVKNVDMEEQMQALRSKYNEVYDASANVVRRNPMLAIGGAVAFGFILGAVMGRR